MVTPHRFPTKRQFWSYCGLGIVMRSSSDWVRAAEGGWMRGHVQQTRGLTRFHNHTLKDIFKGAATTVVTFAGDDPTCSIIAERCDSPTRCGRSFRVARVRSRSPDRGTATQRLFLKRRPMVCEVRRRIARSTANGILSPCNPPLWKGPYRTRANDV